MVQAFIFSHKIDVAIHGKWWWFPYRDHDDPPSSEPAGIVVSSMMANGASSLAIKV